MKRPISAAGLLVMIAAVVIGFKPTIWSILFLFATTLFGAYQVKKHAPESYDGLVRTFGHMVIIFNLVFIGMVMFTPLDPIDKFSAAFLNMMVVIVMVTFLKLQKKHK